MKRDANLLDPREKVEEQNVWLARSSAVVVPLTRSAAEEAIAGVQDFLRRAAGDQEPPKLGPEDVYPFRAIAASNGVDSYFTSQDVKDSLAPMARDFAAGRSVLGNHDYGTFSYGSTTSGAVVDANPDAPEFEAAFYPEVLKGRKELATSKWLQTDAYVIRGLDLNGNKSDSLIRGMELGGIRRISISFTVGSYTCGIDGQDMLAGWFGDPMPAGLIDENATCMHFPGVDYGKDGYGYAAMHGNHALEQSMVYMNSSPSAMLMRKAAVMAERGVLTPKQRTQVEARFGMRLPAFAARVYDLGQIPAKNVAGGGARKEEAMKPKIGDLVRWAVGVREMEGTVEEVDADGRLSVLTIADEGGMETVTIDRVAEPELEVTVVDESRSGEPAAPVVDRMPSVPAPEGKVGYSAHLASAEPTGHSSPPDADATLDQMKELHGSAHEGQDAQHLHNPDADSAAPADGEPADPADPTAAAPDPVAAAAAEPAEPVVIEPAVAAEPVAPEPEPVVEVTAESVTDDFVEAAHRLAAFAGRHADSFESTYAGAIYAAERSVEQVLVDLSAERSVGGDVARQYGSRDRILRDVLGGDLNVGTIRRLAAEAADGRQAKEALVRDTVAARVGVHGEHFDSKAYADMLRTQPMSGIRAELESWKDAKRTRFTSGRSVKPRDFKSDGNLEKRIPTKPAAPAAAEEQPNILEPRSKGR